LDHLNQNTETRLKNLVETKEGLETKVKNLEGQLAQMREVLAAQSEALNRSRQNAGSAQMANSGQNRKPNETAKEAIASNDNEIEHCRHPKGECFQA
jgi:septal ring factor EnvC (AmiA/AmiB activator)